MSLIRNPNPKRDSDFRREASFRYQQLLTWANTQNLIASTEIITLVKKNRTQTGILLPWLAVEPAAENPEHPLHTFQVIFLGEKTDSSLGSFSVINGSPTIILNRALLSPGSIRGLEFRLLSEDLRSSFIHEYIHFQDYVRRNRKLLNTDSEHPETYFKSSTEFNAYYQQGFDLLIQKFNNLLSKQDFIGAGSLLYWDNTRFNLEKFWHQDFLRYIRKDSPMWRRFLKRLRMDFENWAEQAQVQLSDAEGAEDIIPDGVF